MTDADIKDFAYDVVETGFGPNTLVMNPTSGIITWDNMGGDLQVEKNTKANVTFTVGNIAEAYAESNVKVLSTAQSAQ